MHSTEFLRDPSQITAVPPMVVTYGAERYLRQESIRAVARLVLGTEDGADAGLTRLEGKSAELVGVLDELRTISMWGDRRLVVVEDADPFVTEHRAALEKYLEKPARKSVLLLDVQTFPSNTRLYKAIAKEGLPLDCGPLKSAEALRWLVDTAKSQYEKQLLRDAASLMLELVGPNMGLLTQELAKVAAYVGDRAKIESNDVATMVGGWRLETTWAMLDALQGGQLPIALSHLDNLLRSGEAPLMLSGGITHSYRKLAQATEMSRHGKPLNDALGETGVFANKIATAASYLRKLGRPQAERIYEMLVHADNALKGGSRLPERIILERLLIALSGAG